MSPGLSRHEHEILRRIENDLRCDRRLDRALRTMRIPRRTAVSRWLYEWGVQIPALSVAVMIGFAIALTLMVAQTGAPGAWLFLSILWGATAVALGAKVRRHVRERNSGHPNS